MNCTLCINEENRSRFSTKMKFPEFQFMEATARIHGGTPIHDNAVVNSYIMVIFFALLHKQSLCSYIVSRF